MSSVENQPLNSRDRLEAAFNTLTELATPIHTERVSALYPRIKDGPLYVRATMVYDEERGPLGQLASILDLHKQRFIVDSVRGPSRDRAELGVFGPAMQWQINELKNNDQYAEAEWLGRVWSIYREEHPGPWRVALHDVVTNSPFAAEFSTKYSLSTLLDSKVAAFSLERTIGNATYSERMRRSIPHATDLKTILVLPPAQSEKAVRYTYERSYSGVEMLAEQDITDPIIDHDLVTGEEPFLQLNEAKLQRFATALGTAAVVIRQQREDVQL